MGSMKKLNIGIVGDRVPGSLPQQATEDALVHSALRMGIRMQYEWIATTIIRSDYERIIRSFDSFWIAPGFQTDPDGVVRIVRFARENGKPLLGTCGGFQSILIEYARNVLRIEDAAHEEHDPTADNAIVHKLTCSLFGQEGTVSIREGSKAARIYRTLETAEQFRCHYGLNPAYMNRFEYAGLHTAGCDVNGEPRIVELAAHPFFIGTLFVPQLRSTPEATHCLVDSLLEHSDR